MVFCTNSNVNIRLGGFYNKLHVGPVDLLRYRCEVLLIQAIVALYSCILMVSPHLGSDFNPSLIIKRCKGITESGPVWISHSRKSS